MMSHQGSVRGYAVLWSLLAAGAILIRQYYIVSDKSKRYGNYLLLLRLYIQLTTSYTDFFVVAQMSVDLVEFVILVGIGCGLPRLKYVV